MTFVGRCLAIGIAIWTVGCAGSSTLNRGGSTARVVPGTSSANRVATLTDVLLLRGSEGQTVLLSNSLNAATIVDRKVLGIAAELGYQPVSAIGSLVGAQVAADVEVDVQPLDGSAPARMQPPFHVPEPISNSPQRKSAVFALIQSTARIMTLPAADRSAAYAADAAAQDALALLASELDVDLLLLTVGNGRIVSGTERFLTALPQVLMTAAISLALSGGLVMITGYLVPVSWLDSCVVLIDLETKTALWSNSLRLTAGNPASEEYYQAWAWNLLRFMPPAYAARSEAGRVGVEK